MTHFAKGIALAGLLAASSAQADTVLGVYAGAQAWNMDVEGGFANSDDLTEFGFDSNTRGNYYIAVEHFVPLIPNIKVNHTQMDTDGTVNLTSSFAFGDRLFTTNANLNTDIELTSTDIILYYEVFDNDLVSFDFGLNGKYLDGEIFVQDRADSTIMARESFSGIVPMFYSKLAFGLPFTGWGVFAEGSYLSIEEHTMSDYQVAVTYALVDNIAVDLSFQLGYRATAFELDDLDDIYTDLDFDGVFAGVEVHF